MAKHHKEHEGKHHGKHHEEEKERKKGGRVGLVAAGNPDVLKEADEDEDGEETGYKRGGKVKKKKEHKEKMRMDGGSVRARMDRPGRRAGGAVGANTSPLSTAHRVGGGGDGSSKPADTYGGTPK
jgi:hypothetical protein